MDKLKLLMPLLAMLCSGCASFGPTVLIETPEPAEDFVVLCEWYKDGILNIHGGLKQSDHKVFVTESGKEVSCGMSIWGGRGSAKIMHPIYWDADITEQNGVRIYHYTVTKMDRLDELKRMFESGYWDKYDKPGNYYATNLVGCGFPHQYFDYYSEAKKVDKAHFKSLYHESMLECFTRSFSVTKKHDPQIGKQLPEADEWMKRLWASEEWSKYK